MAIAYQPGDIINDQYRITDILGKGGVAITYSAIDLETESNVAIKVISLKQLSDWKQIELFQREAEVLAKLDHPAIPRYIDYFTLETEKDKAFYIVQQQAPGKSLAQLIENGWRTTEKEVKNIAQQILEILIYLHSLEPTVIHRDIKPNNLIRSDEGKIYLVDFGAVQNTYYNTLMQGSTVVGTYGYMAPEQFRGKALPGTDLYSLGATLLYLLTHRSPAELPQDTLKLNFSNSVDISQSFADWLDKILEPDVEDRFASAEVALNQLFASKKKSQKKLITHVGIGILAVCLVLGINSYKWFFLSHLGFYPGDVCSSEVFHNFLQQGGNINVINNKEKIDILFCIIEQQKSEEIQKILVKINSIEEETNPKSYRKRSLIDTAIVKGKYEIIPLLIDRGADINLKIRYDHTPLFRAISQEKLNLAKLLIDNGADVNAKDNTGKSLLFHTFDYGNIDLIKLLLENGADANIKDRFGDTLLFIAINGNNIDLAKLLINHGADINLTRDSGETLLFYAIDRKKPKLAKLLIESGADVNLENDTVYLKEYPDRTTVESGKSPLFSHKIDQETLKILIENGADIDIKGKFGQTPLFYAVSRETVSIAKILIENGADINARDKYGRTPLFESNNQKIAQLLIDAGADVNVKDKRDRTPLFEAKNRDQDVAQLLINLGADVNARDKYGRTPLFNVWDKSAAQLFIDLGININTQDNYGQTALFGVRNKYVAKLLIDQGANVNAKDNYGKTPLFETWSEDVAELLIDMGANVNAQNHNDQTPLSEAVVRRNKELTQLLINSGADTNYLNYQTIKKIYPKLSNQEYQQIKYFLEKNQFKSQSMK